MSQSHKHLIVVGVVIAGVCVFALYSRFSTTKFVSTYGDAESSSLFAISTEYPFNLDEPRGHIDVHVPPVFHMGDSLPVVAKLYPRFDDPKTPTEISALLQTPEIYLSGAGVDVEPKEWLTLLPDGQTPVTWSVKGTEVGSFTLVLNARFNVHALKKLSSESLKRLDITPAQLVAIDTIPVPSKAIRFDAGREITIEVKRAWKDYFAIVCAGMGSFMGSLLTLPGIIAFLRDRKKEREQGLSLNWR
jgi:hypothetical protein